MPRRLTVIETMHKLLVESGYMKAGDDVENGIWGQYSKEMYEKAVWEIAYARKLWSHERCMVAASSTPDQVPADLAQILKDMAKEKSRDGENALRHRFNTMNNP